MGQSCHGLQLCARDYLYVPLIKINNLCNFSRSIVPFLDEHMLYYDVK